MLGDAFDAGLYDRRTMRADVWVDAGQRVRRVIWSPTTGRCRLELWDYGVPVDIPTPKVRPGRSLPRVVYDLWRLRRAWQRDTSGP